MGPRARATWLRAAGVLCAALALLLFARALLRAQSLPEGPEPVAWDRAACAQCRMLIGDPSFAAQLQTTRGDVFHFDDPGCLLLYQHERRPEVHRAYFHHVREERWLPAGEVAFEPTGPTPMGYGLGAVERGADGALSSEEARRRVLERAAAREAG